MPEEALCREMRLGISGRLARDGGDRGDSDDDDLVETLMLR